MIILLTWYEININSKCATTIIYSIKYIILYNYNIAVMSKSFFLFNLKLLSTSIVFSFSIYSVRSRLNLLETAARVLIILQGVLRYFWYRLRWWPHEGASGIVIHILSFVIIAKFWKHLHFILFPQFCFYNFSIIPL